MDTSRDNPLAAVLVCDDESATLTPLADTLTRAGYRVTVAEDEAAARRAVAGGSFELVLIGAPPDGCHIGEHIGNLPDRHTIPLILVSAVDDSDDVTGALEAGAVDVITKPFRDAEVLRKLQVHLELARLRRRLDAHDSELEREVGQRKAAEAELTEQKVRFESQLQVRTEALQREVDERRRAEAVAQESAQRIRDIINFIPDPTFAIDSMGKVIFWNHAIEEMSGLNAADILGKGDKAYALPFYGERRKLLIDLVAELDEQGRSKYENLVCQGGIITTEAFVPVRGGPKRSLWGIAAPLFDSEGRVIGAIETIRDTTERKQTEEGFRIMSDRFRSVLNSATEYSIIGTDLQGIIKFYNVGAERMLGYTAEEMVDIHTPVILHTHEEIAHRAAALGIPEGFEVLSTVACQGKAESREWTYLRKDGVHLPVSVTVSAMRDHNDRIIGFVAIARDLTTEKRLERQYLQSQKMETVGLLAGGISHDFNNLLTPILGYAELLQNEYTEGDSRHAYLEAIAQAASRARQLTSRLLAFSRKQLLDLRPISLDELVHDCEPMVRRTLREDIRIDIRLKTLPGVVMADAGQLELVILNLAINAQDAMPTGGSLTIALDKVTCNPSLLELNPGLQLGDYAVLTVSDTGFGMDESTQQHIFEPFFTTKERGKGTGLGLSTVYGIVRQHGGAVSASSRLNEGTTFRVYLPFRPQDTSAPVPTPIDEVVDVSGHETILLVEDNDLVRSLTHRMLQHCGYRVLEAAGTDECVSLLEKNHPHVDLLLTDVIMPNMNGVELYERLRQRQPALRVLYMSGYAANVIGQHGVLDDGVLFLQKPFSLRQLTDKVRQALEKPTTFE